MARPTLGLIIPTYNHFDYARRAILSAFKYTSSRLHVLLVDDASPDWDDDLHDRIMDEVVPDSLSLTTYRFEENGGLTRSWNFGLQYFRDADVDYICPSNSDVIFTRDWDEPLIKAIDAGWSLVGPLSNNPGVTNPKNQEISYFLPAYKFDQDSDDPEVLAQVARTLRQRYRGKVRETNVNGFCLMSSAEKWWRHSFDRDHVFNPKHKMTFNEDELQRRWRGQLKLKTGACMDSFVFHYRGVTREGKARTGKWMRNPSPDAQV